MCFWTFLFSPIMILAIIIKNYLEFDSLGFDNKLAPYSKANNLFTDVVKNIETVTRLTDASVD